MMDPDKVYHALEEAAERRAEAEQRAYILERQGEILLAELMLKAKREGEPVTLCKEHARSAPEWLVHVSGEAEAVHDRSIARAHYENLRIRFEAMRTVEASTRTLTR
jgi:hypothetical protein